MHRSEFRLRTLIDETAAVRSQNADDKHGWSWKRTSELKPKTRKSSRPGRCPEAYLTGVTRCNRSWPFCQRNRAARRVLHPLFADRLILPGRPR